MDPLQNNPQPSMNKRPTGRIIAIAVVIIVIICIIFFSLHHKKNLSTATMSAMSASSLYTYQLPSGWQSIPNSTQGEQAYNRSKDYIFSVVTIPVPASIGTTTIDKVMTPVTIPAVINSEFPGASTTAVTIGTLDGEKAVITHFNATVTEQVSASSTLSSRPLSLIQYDAIHKGILYILIFMTLPENQPAGLSDFQAIANSFSYKE